MAFSHKGRPSGRAALLMGAAAVCFAELPAAAIGLEAAQAQAQTRPAPDRLRCAPGQERIEVRGGTDDNFGAAADPAPNPSASLLAVGQANPNWNLPTSQNVYDARTINYVFIETLRLNVPSGMRVASARLSSRFRANLPNTANDSISIGHATAPRIGYRPTSGDFSVSFPGGNAAISPAPISGGGGPIPPSQTMIDLLNATGELQIFVQDDTGVDFLLLEACLERDAFDLAVDKRGPERDRYTIAIRNLGRPLVAGAIVQLREIVPMGMTLATLPGSPWTCDAAGPVVGPDAVTCRTTLTGPLPSGASLPPVTVAARGRGMCPNCVRLTVYENQAAFDASFPLPESDLSNNVGCASGAVRPLPARR